MAAWLAILYMIIGVIFGSPELRILKGQLESVNELILKLVEKLPVGKKD